MPLLSVAHRATDRCRAFFRVMKFPPPLYMFMEQIVIAIGTFNMLRCKKRTTSRLAGWCPTRIRGVESHPFLRCNDTCNSEQGGKTMKQVPANYTSILHCSLETMQYMRGTFGRTKAEFMLKRMTSRIYRCRRGTIYFRGEVNQRPLGSKTHITCNLFVFHHESFLLVILHSLPRAKSSHMSSTMPKESTENG